MLSQGILRRAVAAGSLEWLLCDPLAFGLTTATPLQRAACRVIDGQALGELADDPVVRGALGGATSFEGRPKEAVLLGAVRAAKSLLAAAAAVRMSQTCDVSGIRKSEVPRVSVVSLDLDKAGVILNHHLLGALRTSPFLKSIVLNEDDGGSIILRHPTGHPIEVCVAAGKRAGGSLVSYWSAGCIFDEAPRMVGSDDGVVNLDHARHAVLGRLLPGAQILEIGSPFGPFGPVYELTEEYWGKPANGTVVIRGKGPDMNPFWWTPERCAELQRKDPDAYRTDVLAEFLTPEESLFPSDALEAASRSEGLELPYDPALSYRAAMDPATRGNSWTLTLATREGKKYRIVLGRQWTGSSSEPLSPRAVFAEIAPVLREYSIDEVATDQYSADALRDIASEFGIRLSVITMTETEKAKAYIDLRSKVLEKEVELPPHREMLADLRRVKRKATQGGLQIVLPRTNDGRHCDYAPSLVLVMARHITEAQIRSEDIAERERKRMLESVKNRYVSKRGVGY